MMKVFKAFLTLFLSSFLFLPSFASAQDGNLIVIVDSSGSMWGQIGGGIKMDLAKSSLGSALQAITGEPNIGLMAFGHRKKKDCSDIESLSPLSKVDKSALIAKVNSLQPRGKTPLAATLQMAVDEIQSHGEKTTILIISDGMDTCNGDPCALAKKLKAESKTDFVVDVIGLVSNMDGKQRVLSEENFEQLKCITEATGGTFYSVNNARDFKIAVAESMAQEIPEVTPQPETKDTSFSTDQEGIVNLLDEGADSAKVIDAVTVIGAGFVDLEENVSTIGEVIGVDTRSNTIYQNDVITLRLTQEAKVGDKVLAYEIRNESVKDVKSKNLLTEFYRYGDEMGKLYQINGIIEITKIIGDGKYNGKIARFFNNVNVGHSIMPFDTEIVNPPKEYPFLKNPERTFSDAKIISTYNEKLYSGKNDIVYINKGKEDKLFIGDLFEIYPDREEDAGGNAIYPDMGKVLKSLGKPSDEIRHERAGVLTIIGMRKHTAIGYIIQSDRKIIDKDYRLELIQD